MTWLRNKQKNKIYMNDLSFDVYFDVNIIHPELYELIFVRK